MKKIVALSAVLVVMAASRGASALQPEPASLREPEPEALLALGQVMTGIGVSLGGVLLAGVLDFDSAGLAVLMATPLATGAAVCGMGKLSDHNQGSCVGPIGGAYLGALTVIPLAVVGYQLTAHGSDDEWAGLGGAFLGAATGWLLLQPIAATVSWHGFKKPRPKPVALVPRAAPRLLPPARPTHGRTRAPGQVTLTLLSTGF